MSANTTPGDRLQQLERMLEKSPNDPFLLYGIALEHKKAGELDRAARFLDRTIGADAGYCYAYYQLGQVREMAGDQEGARRVYRDGIEAAVKKGDAHARGEIEAALDLLG
jgi:tetratricopeptide (TPR) repeat protein